MYTLSSFGTVRTRHYLLISIFSVLFGMDCKNFYLLCFMCSTGSEPDVYFVDDPKKKLAIIPLDENEFKNVEGLAADI